jgi:glycosyltransferase involved in cell wall biosynthesis
VTDVSVVVPTRNRVAFVGDAVATALGQICIDLEVIVVDDASDDATAASVEGIADPRVRLVRRARPGGPAAARNAGAAAARGEWVAFLDDDDLWAPDKLSRQLGAAREREAGFVYGGALAVDDALEPLYLWRVPDPATVLDALLGLNVIPAGSSTVVARASLLRAVGGFDERFSHLSDWDLWTRLAAAAPAACVADVVTAYRLHGMGQHGDRAPSIMRELDLMDAKHAGLRRERGIELDRASMASYLAKRTVHAEARAARAARGRLRSVVSRARTALRGAAGRGQARPGARPALPRPEWLQPRA